ncbi:hypothetical protein AC1031_004747 [Aphanomyces cochlioides]|nr:hypothetical protein AC1031_004747 [Aphanomyces cochlioides]
MRRHIVDKQDHVSSFGFELPLDPTEPVLEGFRRHPSFFCMPVLQTRGCDAANTLETPWFLGFSDENNIQFLTSIRICCQTDD